METIKKISFSLLVIFFLIVVIGFLLPRKIHIERCRMMKADARILFDQANRIHNWENWSPWMKLASDIKMEYRGEAGIGAGFSWQSKDIHVGEGSLDIIFSKPYDSLQFKVILAGSDPAMQGMVFSTDSSGTRLCWYMDFEMNKNPFMRYFGLIADKVIGKDFVKGLKMLDSIAILEQKKHPPLQIENTEISAFRYFYLARKARHEEISVVLNHTLPELMQLIVKNGIKPLGPPFVIYYPQDSASMKMEIGIPVSGAQKPPPPLMKGQRSASKILMVKYFGPYNGLRHIYDKVHQYSQENNIRLQSYAWETYVTDPSSEPDSAAWETDICFPVK